MTVIKLLFLDVDGVLNSSKTLKRGLMIDLIRCKFIDDLCMETNTLVVLSSTWRMDWPANLHLLRNAGITKLIARTGTRASNDQFERGHQIQDFINETCPDKFAIIDDDMLPEQKNNFVRTNFDDGSNKINKLDNK